MPYDPTMSWTFAEACEANMPAAETGDPAYWQPIFDAALFWMDKDILAEGNETTPLDRLVGYMERHHEKYGDNFTWEAISSVGE